MVVGVWLWSGNQCNDVVWYGVWLMLLLTGNPGGPMSPLGPGKPIIPLSPLGPSGPAGPTRPGSPGLPLGPWNTCAQRYWTDFTRRSYVETGYFHYPTNFVTTVNRFLSHIQTFTYGNMENWWSLTFSPSSPGAPGSPTSPWRHTKAGLLTGEDIAQYEPKWAAMHFHLFKQSQPNDVKSLGHMLGQTVRIWNVNCHSKRSTLVPVGPGGPGGPGNPGGPYRGKRSRH